MIFTFYPAPANQKLWSLFQAHATCCLANPLFEFFHASLALFEVLCGTLPSTHFLFGLTLFVFSFVDLGVFNLVPGRNETIHNIPGAGEGVGD